MRSVPDMNAAGVALQCVSMLPLDAPARRENPEPGMEAFTAIQHSGRARLPA